jgi:hypothetical protein
VFGEGLSPNTEHRTPNTAPRASRRAAFSLLEVLLATTVLIIIVLIVSLIFQQSHNAWSAGTRQADADTTLRTVLGTMARDLTHAVDASAFPGALDAGIKPFHNTNTYTIASGNGIWSDGIVFINMDGTNRFPQVVSYYLDATHNLWRYTRQLRTAGAVWDSNTGMETDSLLSGDFPLSGFEFSVPTPPSGANSTGLPHRVDLAAKVTRSGSLAILSGLSAGPDGDYTTDKDNVVVNP